MKSSFAKILLSVILFYYFCNAQTLREQKLLSGKWQFAVDSTGVGEANNWKLNGLPNSDSRTVIVPHTCNVMEGLEGYSGTAWYQRDFEIAKWQMKKLVRLQFDAVYHDAIIYINGQKAGFHIGSGYTRFFVNISPFIKPGSNRVTVKVSNSYSRKNVPFMGSYDWPNDGGIIRNVYLVSAERKAMEYIHVAAIPNGNSGLANISIKLLDAAVSNPDEVTFDAKIIEENQSSTNTVFSGKLKTEFRKSMFISELSLSKIKKWDFDHPNLYKILITEEIAGQKIDELGATFGFRSIETKDHRIVLNGEPVRLMGLEWMPGSTLERGMAETKEDLTKNLKLMKEANCIFTRFHWQQDDYVFDWCDRHGILVQEEIPYWGPETMLNDTLLNLGYKQLNEMINGHFNHPSIIAWGTGNELESRDTLNISSIKRLYHYAKSIDSSRLVNYVSNRLGMHKSDYPNLPDDASEIGDVLMFNEYYSTWYKESIESIPYHLEKICQDYPDKPLVISEWGLCEPVFKGGDARRCREMVQQIKMFSDEADITGAIYFCLNDYRTHMGEDHTYNYPQRVHGVCDIHLNPKPSYDTLKNISSPVIIKKIEKNNNDISITIMGNTGIPSYIIKGYSVEAGNIKIIINELRPGEEMKLNVNKNVKELMIKRPTGYEVLKISL